MDPVIHGYTWEGDTLVIDAEADGVRETRRVDWCSRVARSYERRHPEALAAFLGRRWRNPARPKTVTD
jgi:hypothetical protein